MFNLHIGIPGVAPDLLHSVEQAGILKGQSSLQVLSRKIWQKKFRKLINEKGKGAVINVEKWRTTKAIVDDLSYQGSVAASQHALLGLPADSFVKSKMLPYTEARIGRVSEIFATVPLTFHLTIQSQFDYLRSIISRLPEGRVIPKPRVIPSWLQLVQRIKTVAPANQIVVWDFEQPTKVTLAFLICLLDTNDARLIEALHKYLIKTLDRPEMPISSHEIPGIDHEFSYHLDVQYELDLEAIRQTDGVLLIRPEDVPEEFYT